MISPLPRTMTPPTDLTELQARMGYTFENPALLERALTHRSYAHEHGNQARLHNEALEFLGDAVLGLVVAEWLVEKYPDSREGVLARFKSYLVSSKHLAECAERLELGAHLRLNRGEEKTGGRRKRALLENTFEAILAALYLDGGFDAARTFVRRLFEPTVSRLDPSDIDRTDAKTALQDWLRAHGLPLPEYVTVGTEGPAHHPEFSIALRLDGEVLALGRGPSLKSAHQSAAGEALEALKQRRGAPDRPRHDG